VLSLFLLAQVITTYTHAYLSAPTEIHTFIDTVEFSIQENESYDKDVAKVQRLEDKLRLGKLLREIQKGGDDLREELNALLVEEGGQRMRASTRILWAVKRKSLEERVRRLDMLRMRFLVVYMGLVAAKTSEAPSAADLEKAASASKLSKALSRPTLPHAFTEEIAGRKFPPMRRLTTQAVGHREGTGEVQKLGWLGVVAELQKSPRMHRRHASIENSLASPTST
jgi:hypothetical protein